MRYTIFIDMISIYDKFIVAFYFGFILIVGIAFRGLNKDTSDYFRCGGAMPWWITGTSAWIASFSAWTFVGAAAKVYETGTLILWTYYPMVLALVIVFFFTCVRFRRMRVVTWVEAVRARYGPGTEQFYTWIKVPLLLLLSGVSLNAIGVFMTAVFGAQMNLVLIVLGSVITIVALVGGAWAVLASDFVQMFLVVTITVTTAILVLAEPKIGGISGLFRQVPSAHFHWSELCRPQIIWLWITTQILFKFSDANNIENSTMYLMAKSDRDARRMVLIPMIGMAIGPLIWFIPSMAATITHPNLAVEYPGLKQPHEAAFVAVAHDVLPTGMLGLLLCAMLGATFTSMDASINKGVGVFVRSFYRPVLNPQASEKHLLIVGKLCTLVFGGIVILIALEVNKLRSVGLFDLTNLLAGTLLVPMAIPLIYGLFFKRTPVWSAWSTAVVGFVVSYIANYHISPVSFQHFMRWQTPLSVREATDFQLAAVTISTIVIGSAWYFFTSLFYGKTSQENKNRIEDFFVKLRTPINAIAEGIENRDEILYRLMGSLCLVFGAFILLLTFIPNTVGGRMCFVYCGGVVVISGWILRALSVSKRRQKAEMILETTADKS